MTVEEVRVVVSQELEHICLVVEHWMAGHCKVTGLLEWVAASYAVRLVAMRSVVGPVEHKRSMQMMQAD